MTNNQFACRVPMFYGTVLEPAIEGLLPYPLLNKGMHLAPMTAKKFPELRDMSACWANLDTAVEDREAISSQNGKAP